MEPQKDIFACAIDHFTSEQEEMRAAAAFAAGNQFLTSLVLISYCFTGNIAIGNLQQFLPAIVKMVESDPKKRLLALHAAKEVRETKDLSHQYSPYTRQSHIVPKVNWKGSQICYGGLCSKTRRMARRQQEMSQLPV